jgi:hypothetical protein
MIQPPPSPGKPAMQHSPICRTIYGVELRKNAVTWSPNSQDGLKTKLPELRGV